MKCWNGIALLTAAMLVSPLGDCVHASPISIEDLSWLSGRWDRTGPGFSIQEQWMDPQGGIMVGMSRTVAGGKTLQYEYLRIEERNGTLVYIAIPSDQEETAFSQEEVTDSTAVFINPKHDFPQRIGYKRLPDGSILAYIEGDVSGQHKRVDFPMRRVSCD